MSYFELNQHILTRNLQILRYVFFSKMITNYRTFRITHFRVNIFERCVSISWSIFDMPSIICCFSWIYSTTFKIKFNFLVMTLSQIMENNWQDQGCLKFEKSELELNFRTVRNSVQFVQPWLKRIFISVTIFPRYFWMHSRVVCIMCIEIFNNSRIKIIFIKYNMPNKRATWY